VAKGRLRLDVLLTEQGLAPTRSRAQALVLAGKVRVDGEVVSKAGAQIRPDAGLEVSEPDHPYVSRGALKLAAILDQLAVEVDGCDCLDVGASTGGFTELLLERGARRVIALDVGRAQLDWKLRTDPRVVVMEGVNARHLAAGDLAFAVDLATIDVSFISLRLVVPALLPFLKPDAWLICLVKPQFEAGREQVGKGGIVRDPEIRRQVIDQVTAAIAGLGLQLVSVIPSPIRGQKGNLEELAAFRYTAGDDGRAGMSETNEMTITFAGGKQIIASYDSFEIRTDQRVKYGGEASAPEPYDLFLASLATCAGVYVLGFCDKRGIPSDGIRLQQSWQRNKNGKVVQIRLDIQVPASFPAKYHSALVRAANQCAVKKTIESPPEIVTNTVVV
jgi:23S rRNA (cytidine1920-2'-O)/16S rRNA (cytidine1409-2'-O)-methyltransferase